MNLSAIVAGHAASQPERPAVELASQMVTYRELDLLARRIAARCRVKAIGPGDIVAVRMRETLLHAATLLAIMRIGAIILPLDWRGGSGEAERVIERFPAKAILSDGKWRARDGAAIGLASLDLTEPDDHAPAPLNNAAMVYGLTSGTTGAPKAIVVTHDQMHARALALHSEHIILEQDRVLSPLPLAFGFGRTVLSTVLCLGATLKLFPSLFEPSELVATVNKSAISVVTVSPNTSLGLLGLGNDAGLLMPNLRRYVTASAKQRPEERSALRARVCPNVVDYYGTIGTGAISLIDAEARKPRRHPWGDWSPE